MKIKYDLTHSIANNKTGKIMSGIEVACWCYPKKNLEVIVAKHYFDEAKITPAIKKELKTKLLKQSSQQIKHQ